MSILKKTKFSKFKKNNVKSADINNKKSKSHSKIQSKKFKFTLNLNLRKTTVKKRLTVSFISITLIPLIITGMLSYLKSSSAMKNKISNYSTQLMNQVCSNVASELSKYESINNQISFSDDTQSGLSEYDNDDVYSQYTLSQKVMNDLQLITINNTSVSGMYLKTLKGTYICNAGVFSDDELKKIFDSSAKADGHSVWTLNKQSSSGYSIVITRDIKSTVTSQVIGSLSVVVTPKTLSSKFESLNSSKNSDNIILDTNGTIVSSNDVAKIGSAYSKKGLTNKIAAREKAISGLSDNEKITKRYFDFKYNGTKYMVTYSPISNTSWYVISLVPYSYLNSEIYSVLLVTILAIIICFLLAMYFVSQISKSILNPLYQLRTLANKAKDGDFSVNVKDDANDEIGELITAFNNMIDKIRNLISKTKDLAQNVSDNSDKLAKISEESSSSSEQIAQTMQQIANGTSEQAQDATECVSSMNNLSDKINTVGSNMKDVSSVLNTITDIQNDAVNAVNDLNDKAAQTNSSSAEIIDHVQSLNKDMQEVRGIVKLIVGISEQTNLLSLNASIEAARAGDAGRGFTVVAKEVRKLADETKEASIKINNMLNEILKKAQLAEDGANKSSEIVKSQMSAVSKTDSSFKLIFDSMNKVQRQLTDMTQSVDEIITSKESTLKNIEDISAISEETAATTEEISASTQEQIAGSQQLSVSADQLNKLVTELNDIISVFKVE